MSINQRITLRELSSENESKVCKLRAKAGQSVDPLGMMQVLAWSKHYFYWCRVIVSQDEVVGIIVINLEIKDKRAPFIHLLLIDAAHQGKGYGLEAMQRVIQVFSRCFKFLNLETDSGTVKFYEKLGFRTVRHAENDKVSMQIAWSDTRPVTQMAQSVDSMSLRMIDATNLQGILELSVKSDQPVQPLSVAREIFRGRFYQYWTRAIYVKEEPVGVMIVNMEPEDGDVPFLNMLMVDQTCQGRGIGKSAIQLIVKDLSRFCKTLSLCTHPIDGPVGFYQALGFKLTGAYMGEKVVLAIDL